MNKSYFSNQIKNNAGFSLLELILAIAIFSLSSFAIATMLIEDNLNTKFNKERTKALYYLKESMDGVISIRNSSTSTDSEWFTMADGDYGLEKADYTWSFLADPDLIDDKYLRTIGILASSTDETTKDVSVNISWDLTPARRVGLSLNTTFTKWIIVTNVTTTP